MGWVNFVSISRVRSLIDRFQPGLVQNDWLVTLYNTTKHGDNMLKNVEMLVPERQFPLGGVVPNCPGQPGWVWWQF